MSNPAKLLWRIGLLLYAFSGGPPASKHAANVKEPAAEQQANRLEATQRERNALEQKLAEHERELKRLQEAQNQLQKQIDELRDVQQHAATNPFQLDVDGLNIRGSRLPSDKGSHPIGGKDWRIDQHGVIRDSQRHPIGVWGIDGDGAPTRSNR